MPSDMEARGFGPFLENLQTQVKANLEAHTYLTQYFPFSLMYMGIVAKKDIALQHSFQSLIAFSRLKTALELQKHT